MKEGRVASSSEDLPGMARAMAGSKRQQMGDVVRRQRKHQTSLRKSNLSSLQHFRLVEIN